MRLLFVHSHKFVEKENNYYTTGQLPYRIFKTRYLNNFESVTVCSRVIKLNDELKLNQSDGENVYIKQLPDLSKIKNRKKAIRKTIDLLDSEVEKANVVVARMPSSHASYAIELANKHNKPLVVEVVGDVFESLWNHGSLIGKLLAPISFIRYRRLIGISNYSIYVTKEQLQRKYPSSQGALTINASNVEIKKVENMILTGRIERERKRSSKTISIGLIGSYATKYKGIHNAIDLIYNLRVRGYDANLRILGSGRNDWLLKKAEKRGVLKHIHFDGLLPTGEPVSEWLDQLDLYVQPSLTEGLPRALIEAMSRGLPAVASCVGGIPELLASDFLHKPNKSKDLLSRVLALISNKNKMIEQSEINFVKAKEYTSEVLRHRRNEFWKMVIKKELS